jgi:alkanesulfonate monooxygenase SsuD/methylene tetrahydromethanopterin reductase-like flavin-dependent oxidoreductase (luciferase family)
VTGPRPFLLGLFLEGGGSLLPVDRLVQVVRSAEAAGVDVVVLDDGFGPERLPPGSPARLDAVLALARLAPETSRIGLVATMTTTHTEPFHLSKNLATLDLVSGGRAGWRVAVSTTEDEARLFGRKGVEPPAELWAEADDALEVVTRLWDSWEDDAVIRDVASGRYLDRSKVHAIDFVGPRFSVRGPSITPRPPQGQPVIVVDVVDDLTADLAARRADVAVVPAREPGHTDDVRADLLARAAAAGRHGGAVTVLGAVHLAAGTDLSVWAEDPSLDGVVLHLDDADRDLPRLTDEIVPALRRSGLVPAEPPTGDLRRRLGLSRPANRYARSGT